MNNFDLTKYLTEGKLHEEDFKNPILDKYLELKKSIDYKTVFPTDLQSFVDSLDNTEREGLKNDLAEGELNENTDAISPEEVRDMAQMVADAFTAEDAEGDRFSTYMVYKVGNVDGMSFELDTEATEQTPEDDAKYGTGEGWGGMFRVKPTDNGYEIRNSEKGGLVATMDGSGFTMLDAEQSKAEMGGDTDYMERKREMSDYMEEGEMLNEGILDTIKDKMVSMGKKLLSKFSPEEQASMKAAAEKVLGPNYSKEDITLDKAKEIGKIISGGLDESQELDENLRKKIGAALLGLGLPTAFIAGHGFGHTDAGAITAGIGTVAAMIGMVMTMVDEGQEVKSNKMKKSELKEMIKAAMLAETSVEETLVDADQDMAEAILNALGGEAAFEAVVRAMSTDDAQTYLGAIMRDHDIEMGPVGDIPGFEGTMDALDALSIREEEEEDVEDVEIDTEEEVDVDMDMDMDSDVDGIDVKQDADTDLGGTVGDVQDNLEAALEAARELGDEKLEDQIGNTLTFFTRTHVVK